MNSKSEMVSDGNLSLDHAAGTRVEIGGYFGTIRYVGSLEGQTGVWYGIEWDDPDRGKHGGSVNGIQYFRTGHPQSGSFVRKEKINFGKSLIEAIVTRYGGQESDISKRIKAQQIVSLQKSIKAPFIEFVGFDKVSTKQSNFESLTVVSARLQSVSSIGESYELGTLCPNIREIDLSKNLLTSWGDIFNICAQLRHLYWINVSENILTFPNICNNIFPNIAVFICGHMYLTWNDIKALSKIFPNISELRAPSNNINDLSTPEDNNFKNLEILDLEGNKIPRWSEVVKLSAVESLQQLSLSEIGLEAIDFESETISYFKNLRKLCISNNNIPDWKSVSELNKIPNLEEIKFLNNPVLSNKNPISCEQEIIARIKTLKICNGRRITPDDRRGAEYDYQKKYGLEWLKVKNTPERNRFLLEHNRYLELIESYGELQVSELKDGHHSKNALITLTFKFEDQTIAKKVSPTMQVQKLKILVQKIFKLPERPHLIIADKDDNIEICLEEDIKEIDYYSVQDGDLIIVKLSN
ncbi:tubulin-specific chaperone E [Cylas formicarius]|uniref:tubulin-specific chaperone E n=1 Tax=Cylas formicarius TaxID=197179 RepID=UPI002958DA65|nr:tubulin-specific chaperone E [Cylas formicarius]